MDHAEEKQTKIKLLFTVKTINKNYTNFPSWFEQSYASTEWKSPKTKAIFAPILTNEVKT